jgi:predicted nucleic acid-binding protein
MKTLFDTTIIVSGIVESHPMHSKCPPQLQRAKAGGFEGVVVSQTLSETYAVSTTLPVKPRISPLGARKLVYTNMDPGQVRFANHPRLWGRS